MNRSELRLLQVLDEHNYGDLVARRLGRKRALMADGGVFGTELFRGFPVEDFSNRIVIEE